MGSYHSDSLPRPAVVRVSLVKSATHFLVRESTNIYSNRNETALKSCW